MPLLREILRPIAFIIGPWTTKSREVVGLFPQTDGEWHVIAVTLVNRSGRTRIKFCHEFMPRSPE